MRSTQFLYRTILFLLPLVAYFIMNISVNHYLYSNQKLQLDTANILVIGDSHPTRSINPDFLQNAVSISQTAEPYVLTYWKLEKVLKTTKPSIVVVGLAPHNLSQFNDFKFSDSFWSLEMFKRSYPIQRFKEVDHLIEIDYKKYWEIYLKNNSFYPKLDHSYYIGGYSNSDLKSISGWKTSINRHYYFESEQLDISTVSIKYLDSIIELCQKNDIEVFLVSSPVRKEYYDGIPERILIEFDKQKLKYRNKAFIFDKTDDFSYPDSLFRNSDHVNKFGAVVFTKELNRFIQKNQN
ncbi:hypothetical protein [Marivirga harenae]|uniref:hypothetical protein n=1 Tax=Marivirga harenae TaxID=2010992 RepID=UPI0026E0B146|nr:hypothetical protein [Marivirga harenae]WKV12879.1 hypothetical protein Q3Y49_03430 [Marivirga harenae]